jgi:hypothetical protein
MIEIQKQKTRCRKLHGSGWRDGNKKLLQFQNSLASLLRCVQIITAVINRVVNLLRSPITPFILRIDCDVLVAEDAENRRTRPCGDGRFGAGR